MGYGLWIMIEKVPTTVDKAMDETSKNASMKNIGNAKRVITWHLQHSS
jgi:hypothetical protein